MELLFCGTAAAEAWPALFCTCAPCQEARRRGGKDVRSRTAYMLGEHVRVDFGPDSNLHMQRYNLAYERLQHLLITHSHEDHWTPHELHWRRPGFSVVPETCLQVWGNAKVAQKFAAVNGDDWQRYRIEFHQIGAWQRFDIGEGLEATTVLAAHDPSEECVNYLIEYEGRAALLGHDTGWYDEPAWEFLSRTPLNMLVLDCTYGAQDGDRSHLGCASVVRARDEFAKRSALAPDVRIIATHFSHNGGWLHEDLERYFAPHGISVAYDGLKMAL